MQTKKDCLKDKDISRKEVREFHKNLRSQMSEAEVAEKSRQITDRLLQTAWYQNAEVIYGYAPLSNEVDDREFLEQALSEGKVVALPKTGADCSMEFYQVTSLTQLVEGRFHVMEPDENCPICEAVTPVILIPGVVFDRTGNRYGYGKGYYDRYFARYRKAERIALAYEHQIEPYLEVLPTDVKMQRIYTETAEYLF